MKKVNVIMLGVTLVISASQAIASQEKWYSYWSIGISDNTYPSDLQSTFDLAEDSELDRSEIAIDFVGFYWPIGNSNTIHGFVINGTSDTLSRNGNEPELSFNTYLYSYSVMSYFGQEPGDGFYLRGDIGLAKGITTVDSSISSFSSDSDWGNGFLFGVGYGIPVSSGSRVIIGLNRTSKTIEDENYDNYYEDYSATMLSIGGLW